MKNNMRPSDTRDSRDTRHEGQYAADVFMLRNMPPEHLKLYPPNVLAKAEKCADPHGYLHTWLKLEKTKTEARLLRSKFVLQFWKDLLEADFTQEQLEAAAESGEGFERIMREAYIQDMIPPRFRDAVKKLKRFRAVWRFPLDLSALAEAARAVRQAARNLPQKTSVGTTEFLPDTEGRITLFDRHGHSLPVAEKENIEASRDAALERMFTLSPGARDEVTEFNLLRDSYSLPAGFRHHALQSLDIEIRNAVAKGDLDFFVRLGECLKKTKAESKKADASFIKRFQQHRLALFLIEHWLPSPRLRGTWLYDYLSNPEHFTKAGIHLSPRWLSSGALNVTLGERQAAKHRKAPGLCFFADAALVKVCNGILKAHFKKHTVNKTIRRLGLRKCPRQELLFTQVEESGGIFLAYRSSSYRAT